MATIIQPYNPWRENLAANLLGPLLGNAIGDAFKRHQEANANRKLNTAVGTALQALGTMGQQSMMNGEPVPNGYNDNQWDKAFHQNYTPMTQYNLGTAGITPQAQTLPTSMDAQKALADTLANPRFSMVNPTQAQQAMTPYLQSLEQATIQQRRADAANAVSNAQNDMARLAAMYRGGIEGTISPDLIKLAQGQYQYDNPYLQQYSQNQGQTTVFGGFNPRTGDYTQRGFYRNTLTPEQVANIALKRYEIDENTALGYDANNVQDHANYLRFRQGQDELDEKKFQFRNPPLNLITTNTGDKIVQSTYNPSTGEYFDEAIYDIQQSPSEEAKNEIAREQIESNERIAEVRKRNLGYQVMKGGDGITYVFDKNTGEIIEAQSPDGTVITYPQGKEIRKNKNGEYEVVDLASASSQVVTDKNGKPLQGPQSKNLMTDTQKNRIERLDKELKALDSEISNADFMLNIQDPNTPEYEAALAKVEGLHAEKKRKQQEREGILKSAETTQQPQQQVQNLLPPIVSQNITPPERLMTLQPLPVGGDISPDVPQQQPISWSKGGAATLAFPSTMAYNPSRDMYVPEGKIMTVKSMGDYVNKIRANDPEIAKLSPEEIVKVLEEEGFRIKQ